MLCRIAQLNSEIQAKNSELGAVQESLAAIKLGTPSGCYYYAYKIPSEKQSLEEKLESMKLSEQQAQDQILQLTQKLENADKELLNAQVKVDEMTTILTEKNNQLSILTEQTTSLQKLIEDKNQASDQTIEKLEANLAGKESVCKELEIRVGLAEKKYEQCHLLALKVYNILLEQEVQNIP